MILKNRIRELRKNRKITTAELADILNISPRSLNAYEINQRKPSIEILIKISEYFNCSIDYLVYKTEFSNIESYNKIISNAMSKGLTFEQLNLLINIWLEIHKNKETFD